MERFVLGRSLEGDDRGIHVTVMAFAIGFRYSLPGALHSSRLAYNNMTFEKGPCLYLFNAGVS